VISGIMPVTSWSKYLISWVEFSVVHLLKTLLAVTCYLWENISCLKSNEVYFYMIST
jgi:hypothetical protein